MKERPILFSGEMVRAILDGRKTQTRRVVRGLDYIGGRGQEHDPASWGWAFDGPSHHGWMVLERGKNDQFDHGCISIPCPYGQPGALLWVREAWHSCPHCPQNAPRGAVYYRSGGYRVGDTRDDADSRPLCTKCAAHGWRPSIHMPRWASRITLRVTDVRVQRLQDITDEDAKAEGVGLCDHQAMHRNTYARAFACLWDRINGKRAPWSSNPWVWAVSFERVKP